MRSIVYSKRTVIALGVSFLAGAMILIRRHELRLQLLVPPHMSSMPKKRSYLISQSLGSSKRVWLIEHSEVK